MFTKTTLFHKPGEGGGSGGDQHNLGWYATQSALETAHATATAGDWAIVGSTDTVWIWDTDTSAWKDSDQKGQVTSVNGQTGDVTVGGLPSQTGQSGKFLTTDGTDASWSDKPLVNKATGSGTLVIGDNATDDGCDEVTILGSSATVGSRFFSGSIAIGSRASVMGGGNSVVIGECAESRGDNTVVVGYGAKATAEGAIQLGTGGTNSVANTFKVWNNNGNFEIMSADGTIPEARLADTTNAAAGQVLTLDSNLNAVWAAGGSGGGISDVTVNGISVVSGGVAAITCATIDDTSTSSQTATWSASKLNTTIGNIESLLAAI